MFVNYIMPTQGGLVANGAVAQGLAQINYDTGLKRPFLDERGRPCVSVNTGRFEIDKETGHSKPVRETVLVGDLMQRGVWDPIYNAASLNKQEWEMYDAAVVKVQRERLRAWADLASWGSFGGFNGMGKLTLEHETMTDPGYAHVDFDALSEASNDSPKFQLEGLPLPITHSSFSYSLRRLTASRNSGEPLDTLGVEWATRRVVERVEQTLIGTVTGVTGLDSALGYGRTPQVYGYSNFPDRITKNDLTAPTGSNGETIVDDVLAMIESASDANHHGPFILYHSRNWEKYMDDDYRDLDDRTLRQRLLDINKIRAVEQLDSLTTDSATDFRLIMVQMTSDVARAVTGMPMQVLMWETHGGLKVHFKVMTIMVPQLFADANGNTGIVDARTP